MSIEVVENTVYELQQRVRPEAPAEMRAMGMQVGDAEGWHHTKNWKAGDENGAYYWKERWESLWGKYFEFRFNPTKAIPVRPERVTPAPFNLAEATQEVLDEALSAKKAQA